MGPEGSLPEYGRPLSYGATEKGWQLLRAPIPVDVVDVGAIRGAAARVASNHHIGPATAVQRRAVVAASERQCCEWREQQRKEVNASSSSAPDSRGWVGVREGGADDDG